MLSECQNYDGEIGNHGYGLTNIGNRKVLTHRLAWALHNGADPAGKVVRHKCDNRSCVNPEHLEIGTQADNVKDMFERKRAPIGSQRSSSKLDEKKVSEIKSLLADGGFTQKEIADMYGVHRSSVMLIKHGKNWPHVKVTDE